MLNTFIKLLDKLSYLISPPYCEFCKLFTIERSIFCKHCMDKVLPISSLQVKVNSKYTLQIHAISKYDYPLKTLILSKSYSKILASKQLGQLMWDLTIFKSLKCDYLIPIPLHWSRTIKRGYNQSQVIAKTLSDLSNKPVVNILKRSKATKYQFSLSVDERKDNLKNAFELNLKNPELYENKDLILVDDLFTTGSTAISAAKELAKLGPRSISVIVACRVI